MSWLHPPTSNHKLCFVTATLTSWHHIQPCLEFLIWSNSRNTFQTQKKCWRQEKFSDSCHWSSWLNHLDDEDDLLLTVISVSGWWTVSTLYWTLLDTGHHSSTLLHCGHCTSVSWPGTQQSIPRLPPPHQPLEPVPCRVCWRREWRQSWWSLQLSLPLTLTTDSALTGDELHNLNQIWSTLLK